MAALAHTNGSVPSPAAVGCARVGCIARGTACQSCVNRDVQRVELTDGQASFILRTKLAAACAAGEGFDVAWMRATAEIVSHAPHGQARSWRVALDSVRPEFAEAYRRLRIRLGQRST